MWQSEISVVDLKNTRKTCRTDQWSLFDTGWFFQGLKVVFPFSDASSALKAPAITQSGGMLSILLFSANPCGNQGLLAVSWAVFIKAMV